MAANACRPMPPLYSLLNPPYLAQPAAHRPTGHATSLSPASSNATASSSPAFDKVVLYGERVSETPSILGKSKPRGTVNYYPFENLEGAALDAVLKFQVTPFGQIHKGFQHIPYSSSKKDLFEKTGRESIEAFRYEFRVPGHDRVYVVMWDYNIGIVRMNPFIKWGGFPKTKSSQMLDKNPGLRGISPGITGGAVSAQGYWVPYRCARALCATFCFPIAGALIPLFGPTFPSECIPLESAAYNDMLISRTLLAEDARDAAVSRRHYMSRTLASRNGVTSHPRPEHYPTHHAAEHGFSAHIGQLVRPDASWPMDNIATAYRLPPQRHPEMGYGLHEYKITAHTGVRFTPANLFSPEEDPFERADPYLSAMPQRQKLPHYRQPEVIADPPKRRRLEDREKPKVLAKPAKQLCSPPARGKESVKRKKEASPPRTLAHYNAAMVLVTLSSDTDEAGVEETEEDAVDAIEAISEARHVDKRQRAKSV